jgi:hypothetical protein
VDETSFLAANRSHATVYATGLVDLEHPQPVESQQPLGQADTVVHRHGSSRCSLQTAAMMVGPLTPLVDSSTNCSCQRSPVDAKSQWSPLRWVRFLDLLTGFYFERRANRSTQAQNQALRNELQTLRATVYSLGGDPTQA